MSKWKVDYEKSLKRAKAIRKMILKKFPHIENITIDKRMNLHVVNGFMYEQPSLTPNKKTNKEKQ